MVHFKVTAYTLKCVDKAGGLDNYLLHTNDLQSADGEKAKLRLVEILDAETLAMEILNPTPESEDTLEPVAMEALAMNR
jgi:hypothetical protein